MRDEGVQDLVVRRDSSIGELVWTTSLQLDVLLAGGCVNMFISKVARVDLGIFKESGRAVHLFRSVRLMGVEVQDRDRLARKSAQPASISTSPSLSVSEQALYDHLGHAWQVC